MLSKTKERQIICRVNGEGTKGKYMKKRIVFFVAAAVVIILGCFAVWSFSVSSRPAAADSSDPAKNLETGESEEKGYPDAALDDMTLPEMKLEPDGEQAMGGNSVSTNHEQTASHNTTEQAASNSAAASKPSSADESSSEAVQGPSHEADEPHTGLGDAYVENGVIYLPAMPLD